MGRGAYILRRLLLLIPTLLAIYTLTFMLIHSTPGGPWSQGEKPVPPIVLKRLNEAYGLDKPLWRQYVDYLWNLLQGDFGPSFTSAITLGQRHYSARRSRCRSSSGSSRW